MIPESKRGDPRGARPSSRRPPACPFCAGVLVFAFAARDREQPAGPTFDYRACESCGALVQDAPELVGESVGTRVAYTRTQRIPRGLPGGWLGWRRLRTRALLALPSGPLARAVSGKRFGGFEWFRRTATRPDDPVLDVGCGSGRLLFRLAHAGFTDLTGIDPFLAPETLERAAGRPELRFAAQDARSHSGRYRLVMSHHSLEHTADPRASFAALARLVRPGGWLLLRVPIADSWARDHYGPDWVQLDAPRHLAIPTRASLARLAQDCGLSLVRIDDDSGVFQIWGSERALPPRGPARLLRWLAARRQAARIRRAGRGDQAAFYFCRPD